MAAEAEARMFSGTPSKDADDGTFLTDLMGGKKPDRRTSASALKPDKPKDDDSEM